MKLFFFDTETTGVNPNKDRIIQFGAIYGEYDLYTEEFQELERINQYINIKGEIPYGASQVHGIYKRDLEGYGYIEDYIDEFLLYMGKADYVIGHNVEFDKNMIIAEAKRLEHTFDFGRVKWVDTMKPTTEFVNGKGGRRPKLIHLHEKLFGRGFDGAHDAMADIVATKDCFLALKKYGFFEEVFSLPLREDSPSFEEQKVEENKERYDAVYDFKNGYARVRIGEKRGFINEKREEICKIKYDGVGYFKNGYARVRIGEKRGFINEKREEICKIKYDGVGYFENGYARVKIGEKQGFINEQGEEVSEIKYDEIKYDENEYDENEYEMYGFSIFQDGYAMVRIGEKRGFINEQGEEICEIKYDEIEYNGVWYFKNGYARVRIGEKRGFINERGEEVCEIKYDGVWDFENGYAGVRIGEKRGF
ncbi:MAG: hypothetical protein DLD55_05000, partial [candidate division SR1 bacterium]